MDRHLCTCRETQLRSGLLLPLFLLMMLADLTLPAQRHPPVVLGETRVQGGGGWILQDPVQPGSGGPTALLCICFKHETQSIWFLTWVSSVSPPPAIPGMGVVWSPLKRESKGNR
jgi:hypothetical protein